MNEETKFELLSHAPSSGVPFSRSVMCRDGKDEEQDDSESVKIRINEDYSSSLQSFQADAEMPPPVQPPQEPRELTFRSLVKCVST